MNRHLKEKIVQSIMSQVGEEFSNLMELNQRYRSLISERAFLCSSLECPEDLARYIELDEEIMEIETHYAYMLGVTQAELFQDVVLTREWNDIETRCDEYFGTELEGDEKPLPRKQKRKSYTYEARPRRSFGFVFLSVIACIFFLTGACLPRLYSFFIDGDTLVRQSGMLELPPKEGESFRSMEEALSYYDLKGAITWIPEAYALDYVEAKDIDGYLSIYAWYQSESDDAGGISFRCVQYQDPKELVERFEIEKEGGEEAHANGITYYVTKNKETRRAVWNSGDCLFSLKGTITEAELQQIIQSIEKEE